MTNPRKYVVTVKRTQYSTVEVWVDNADGEAALKAMAFAKAEAVGEWEDPVYDTSSLHREDPVEPIKDLT